MNVSGLTDDQVRAFGLLVDQVREKQDRNKLRAAVYDGKRAARDLGISMPPQMRRLTYVLGWGSKAVDLLNRRCRLEGFTSPDAPIADLGLLPVIEGNRFLVESSQGQSSSLIHATGFLSTSRGDVVAGDPDVVFTFRDALNATGEWDARARRLRSFLSIVERDEHSGEPAKCLLFLPGLTFTVSRQGGGGWSADGQSTSLDYVPVEPVVFKPRLGRPFGSSRITRPMLSLLDQAMRTLGRSESQAEIFSLPQRYAMGADSSMFKDENGVDIPRWKILLGGIWWAENNEDNQQPTVGQFPQASQQPHLDHLRTIAQLFAGEASVPAASLGMTIGDANPTSAEALLAQDTNLIAEAEGATDEWGAAYARSMLTATRMLGSWSPDLRIRAKWRNPRHESRAAAADAGQKQLAAVPWLAETSIGLELLGLDADQIERALAERRRASVQQLMASLSAPAPVAVPQAAPEGV